MLVVGSLVSFNCQKWDFKSILFCHSCKVQITVLLSGCILFLSLPSGGGDQRLIDILLVIADGNLGSLTVE